MKCRCLCICVCGCSASCTCQVHLFKSAPTRVTPMLHKSHERLTLGANCSLKANFDVWKWRWVSLKGGPTGVSVRVWRWVLSWLLMACRDSSNHVLELSPSAHTHDRFCVLILKASGFSGDRAQSLWSWLDTVYRQIQSDNAQTLHCLLIAGTLWCQGWQSPSSGSLLTCNTFLLWSNR